MIGLVRPGRVYRFAVLAFGTTGWLGWWGLLATWTVALLTPIQPVLAAVGVGEPLSPFMSFVVSKSMHVTLYGTLTGLLGLLPGHPKMRLALACFLAFHGALTEFLQLSIPGRTGSVRDVALDLLGVLAGGTLALALAWPGWPRARC